MTYKTHDPTVLIGQLHFLAILHIGKGAPAWQAAPFPIANDKTQKSEKTVSFICLGGCGTGQHHVGDVIDSLPDPGNGFRFCPGSRKDRLNVMDDVPADGNDLLKMCYCFPHLGIPFLHHVNGAPDQLRDALGRCLGLVGKVCHLPCHHRKARTHASCTCCLDGGVECQKVRLPGDLIHGADDVFDLFRAALDLLHGSKHLCHLLLFFQDTPPCGIRQFMDALHPLCGRLDHLHHLFIFL